MKKIAVCLALVLLLALCACAGQSGVITGFEGSDPLTLTEILGTGVSSPTGRVMVELPDGSTVKATCDFTGVKEGTAVTVEQTDNGEWVVTEIR